MAPASTASAVHRVAQVSSLASSVHEAMDVRPDGGGQVTFVADIGLRDRDLCAVTPRTGRIATRGQLHRRV
jgi:hypothetical protein